MFMIDTNVYQKCSLRQRARAFSAQNKRMPEQHNGPRERFRTLPRPHLRWHSSPISFSGKAHQNTWCALLLGLQFLMRNGRPRVRCAKAMGPGKTSTQKHRPSRPQRRIWSRAPPPTKFRPRRVGRAAPRNTDTPLPPRPHHHRINGAAPFESRRIGRVAHRHTNTPLPPRLHLGCSGRGCGLPSHRSPPTHIRSGLPKPTRSGHLGPALHHGPAKGFLFVHRG
ncbi:unnamed protein product [Parnassius mnemosyne]|uniref:Uncharacterized protein n=1 Tax=Parnassius mnemosyne TaxID=213953 RepID=A0AAV1LF69_9NEOP